MEWRKEQNKFVVYSLGNFVSGQRDRYKNGGAMVRLDLSKVTKDSISSATLDSARFILEWVYRTTDVKRKYYVLPVPTFENDTTGFIKDEGSRFMMKTFIDDSRKLLRANNLNITEIVKQPAAKPNDP
jgi:poly-gamma-glutamate synthesis protein (capsule biosynthesis protein)